MASNCEKGPKYIKFVLNIPLWNDVKVQNCSIVITLKYLKPIGHIGWHFVHPVRKLSLAHTRINTVWETMIYKKHIKFELKKKQCLDTSIFLIIWLHRL